ARRFRLKLDFVPAASIWAVSLEFLHRALEFCPDAVHLALHLFHRRLHLHLNTLHLLVEKLAMLLDCPHELSGNALEWIVAHDSPRQLCCHYNTPGCGTQANLSR